MAPTRTLSGPSRRKQKHPAPTSHDLQQSQKSQDKASKRSQGRKSRCDPRSLPRIFRRYLEANSTVFPSFSHNPRFASSSLALDAALDYRENDLMEHAGDSVHNVTVAKVLFDHFYPDSGSTEEGEEEGTAIDDIQKRHAAFEYSTTLFHRNATLGIIQAKMDGDPIPTSGDDLKLYANDFEAHACYIKKTYVKERLVGFYKALILPAMPSVEASFDIDYANQGGTNVFLGHITRHRIKNYTEVRRKHETALMDVLEKSNNEPIRDHILGLNSPELHDPPITFDQMNRVVEDCRPLDFIGYLLWKEALGLQAERLYSWHHAHQVGGAGYRTRLCGLAASKGAVTFLARLAGFQDEREDEDTERLPSRFYVAIGKLWKSDEAQLGKILKPLAIQMLLHSAQVLFDHGVSLPFFKPKRRFNTPA